MYLRILFIWKISQYYNNCFLSRIRPLLFSKIECRRSWYSCRRSRSNVEKIACNCWCQNLIFKEVGYVPQRLPHKLSLLIFRYSIQFHICTYCCWWWWNHYLFVVVNYLCSVFILFCTRKICEKWYKRDWNELS